MPLWAKRPYNRSMETRTPTATLLTPNAQTRYEVGPEDLPLCCPMPQMQLWNSHPRVYLAIEKTGEATCPYCGAEFLLRR